MVPTAGWDWDDLLAAAGGMLDKAFNPERCGATLRYGDAGSSSALRGCGRLVYEGTKDEGDEGDGLLASVQGQIRDACWGEDADESDGYVQHRFTFDREPNVFDDVGGVEAWQGLNEKLKKTRLGGK